MSLHLDHFDSIIKIVTQPKSPIIGVLSGYEFTSLCKLQLNPLICECLVKKERGKEDEDQKYHKDLPMLLDSNERLTKFIKEQIRKLKEEELGSSALPFLSAYIYSHNLTELHLDAIFKYGDDNQLPKELFQSVNTKLLSLKFNSLEDIPAEIGRMEKLESLILTNNKLQNRSIPYTLTFCTKLKELKLDNNLLDALPGFLLTMKSLETVHRHGNHNYFKSTFMWYHTDINQRVIALPRQTLPHNPFSNVSQASFNSSIARSFDITPNQPLSLECICIRRIIGNKLNFFKDVAVSPRLKDLLSSSYHLFNVCDSCKTACLYYQPGYKVITFKNPYLGNTCIPFQHWTCSYQCALCIEIPAREEQVSAARELDKQYEDYTQSCQYSFIEPTKFKRKNTKCAIWRGLEMPRLNTKSLFCWCSRESVDLSSTSLSSSSSSVVLRNHSHLHFRNA